MNDIVTIEFTKEQAKRIRKVLSRYCEGNSCVSCKLYCSDKTCPNVKLDELMRKGVIQ